MPNIDTPGIDQMDGQPPTQDPSQHQQAASDTITPPSAPLPADRAGPPAIEGYAIQRALGQGGMGTVFLARDLKLDRDVALKILPQRVAADPDDHRRFAREARALARIVHPNIVPIYSFGASPGGDYIAMAYVDGTSLREILRDAREGRSHRFARLFSREPGREKLADLACARVARTIAEALAAIHEAGIVHRDVKPANVVIDSKGSPFLVDFGIACTPASGQLACDAISTGTLRYMAPESLDGGTGRIDPRTDIYSLGVMLFEMLTLAPAFPSDEMDALLRAVPAGLVDSPRDRVGSVSRTLDRIVRRATARRPEERFATALEFADALRRAEHELAHAELLAGERALDPDIEGALRGARSGSWFSRLLGRLRGAM